MFNTESSGWTDWFNSSLAVELHSRDCNLFIIKSLKTLKDHLVKKCELQWINHYKSLFWKHLFFLADTVITHMVQNLMKTIQNRGWQQTGVLDCKSFVVCIHADGFVQVVSSPFLFCIKKRGHCSCKINIGSEFTNFSAVSAKMKFHSPLTETTKTHVSKPDKSAWMDPQEDGRETQCSSSICKLSNGFKHCIYLNCKWNQKLLECSCFMF